MEFQQYYNRTEEMRPEWFSYDNIPFDTMWPDDRIWFPLFLKGQQFLGEFHFSEVMIESTHELFFLFFFFYLPF